MTGGDWVEAWCAVFPFYFSTSSFPLHVKLFLMCVLFLASLSLFVASTFHTPRPNGHLFVLYLDCHFVVDHLFHFLANLTLPSWPRACEWERERDQ